MDPLQVFLFGKFEVRCGRQPLPGLDAHRVQQLFCYLLLHRDRPHPREALADVLWNEDCTDRPNCCLRRTLWQLRSALDAYSEPFGDRVLLIEPDWIEIHPGAALWLDVADFERAFERVRGMPGRELDAAGARSLRDAVDLYRGGLQESWYQDWYLYERERFRHMYLVMLDKLMDYCEACRGYEEGLAYGTLILRCDRASERTHRRMMRLHCLAGDRTAALRQYGRCSSVLREELGVQPARSTVTLHEQIRMDRLSDLSPAPIDEATTATASLLPQVLERLEQLDAVLVEVQRRVRQDISAVGLAIDGQR